jgi:hypothetical protein
MTLKEVADKLQKPNWLPDRCIHVVHVGTGFMPLEVVSGDTIAFVVLFPPDYGNQIGAWLRISGKVDEQLLRDVLRGSITGGRVAESRLAEIVCSK